KGKNKDEIITYFADTYGEQMLGTPRPTGFNQAALLMPLAAVALGMIPIGLALSRRKKNTVSVPLASQSTTENSTNNSAAAAPPEDPRVAAALRDYDF
ncbi:MAG TPA: cytochrome c-type biogenesis protein CcmH, partial [Abditibacteriaceae bacterium]